MLFKVDEGKQYHVRDVEIHGIDPQAEQALKSQFGYGQVFDVAPFRNFFEEHKSGLPTDVSLDDAIQVRRDLANASVDIVFGFSLLSQNVAGPTTVQLLGNAETAEVRPEHVHFATNCALVSRRVLPATFHSGRM